MAKYTSVRRNIPKWSRITRKLIFTVALTFLLIVACICVINKLGDSRISKIYQAQSSLSNIYDMEIKYIDQRPSSSEDAWLPIVDLGGHIYSAYLDPRPEVIDRYSHGKDEIAWSVVRIIALLPTKIDEKTIECVYKYPQENYGNEKKRRPVTSAKPMADNWSLEYSAFFIICDLTIPDDFIYEDLFDINQLPESVAIGLPNSQKLTFIDIHYPEMGISQFTEPPSNFMALCVPVLHHSFNRPLDLVEFIEYYRLLGVKNFTFYNSSITPEVSKVLTYYKNEEVATVLKWQLPSQYVYEKTLRHEGLFASINDCLYRNTFHESYGYIGHFGLDEFLVPKKHEYLPYLLQYLDPSDSDKDGPYASFVFRNVFFYTMYEDDRADIDPKLPYLYTHAKTWALKEPNEAGDRSRYIVRGRDVVELGNYRAVELRSGSSTYPKRQDTFTRLNSISRNPVGAPLIWDWVRENWEFLVNRYTLTDRYLGRLIPSPTNSFATDFQLKKMEAFFEKYPEVGSGKSTRTSALETIRNNIKWAQRNTFRELIVEPEVALSHQYAPCEAEETGCYLKPIVIDKSAQKFSGKLAINVDSVCKQVFGAVGCPFMKKQTLV